MMGRGSSLPGLLAALAFAAGTLLTAAAPSPSVSPSSPIDLAALYHDSRDGLYRTPSGAVTAGSTVTLRLRTLHDDARAVQLFLGEKVGYRAIAMSVEAAAIPCGSPPPAGGPDARCDLWSAAVPTSAPTTLKYHFVVKSGSARAYVSDDARADGGPGIASSDGLTSDWIITVYQPGLRPVSWLQGAVVYQVFPDRFVNGSPANDADPTQPRYGHPPLASDRVVREKWGTPPPDPSSGGEYYGGDLAGIRSKLPYLHDLGVSVLYLNPIFASASNHGYDTRDYYRIDPRFGTQADFDGLVRDAAGLGIHVVLDGVFDHVSSDSRYFDRYGRAVVPGACASVASPYRAWFVFTPQVNGPCAGPDGPHTMGYSGWSSIATLPMLDKRNAAVQDLIYSGPDSVARHWLTLGASGWRIDTMADTSFPAGFWQAFRAAVKAVKPDAPIVGEAWQRDQVLPLVRGDTADTVMDYRSRSPLLAYLGTADARGFADDRASNLAPSVLVSKLAGVLEDEPPSVAGTEFRLLDSHDTERVLWSLTPGTSAAEKEAAANVAVGKARLRLASLIQFTLPGAPVVYYGDEVGMTGATDPDDRRTYPVSGGDTALAAWYRQLATIRSSTAVLRDGGVRFLLADDASRGLAFARTAPGALSITAVNPGTALATLDVPLARPIDGGAPIRDGIHFRDLLGGPDVTSAGGQVRIELSATGAALLVPEAGQDVTAPTAPPDVAATRTPDGVSLRWSASSGASSYTVWRSPVAGGGYVLAGEASGPSFVDAGAPAGAVHYVVRALDAAGNVSDASADQAVGAAGSGSEGSGAAAGSTGGEGSGSGPVGGGSGAAPGIAVDLLPLAVAAAVALAAIALVTIARVRRRGGGGEG